jgi:hypothetical protein
LKKGRVITWPCFLIANFPLGSLPTVEHLITKCIMQLGEIEESRNFLEFTAPALHAKSSSKADLCK